MKKRFIISLFAILCSFGTARSQERINEFVVNIDETHNPMTIYSSYGATPNDGVVIVNSTIPNLEFNIPAAPGRIKTVPDKKKNRYVLIIQPNDNNYKQYTITINAKRFKQGKIDSVVVKAGLSSGYIVNPNHETNNTVGGHEYVDLGLPSRTLWATCNVGAFKPEANGDHYAWGEIVYKSTYSNDNYKFVKKGDMSKLTKYCTVKQFGYRSFIDWLTTLETCDDVATSKWGDGWRIPTKYQWEELIDKCRWTLTKGGFKVVGSNGNSIFLPLAGTWFEGSVSFFGRGGLYWSSSLDEGTPSKAWIVFLNSDPLECVMGSFPRCICGSVRPVCSSQK